MIYVGSCRAIADNENNGTAEKRTKEEGHVDKKEIKKEEEDKEEKGEKEVNEEKGM